MSARNRWITGGIALLLVLAGVGASFLFGAGDSGNGTGESNAAVDSGANGLDRVDSDPTDGTDESAVDAGDSTAEDSDAVLTAATTGAARQRATSVNDTPTPPRTSTPASPATDPTIGTPVDPGPQTPANPDDDGLTEEERQYLEETRQIVEMSEDSLREAADQLLQAIIDCDEGVLTTRLAEDEGPQPDYVTHLASRYPEITAVDPVRTVNVFSTDNATVYFTYAQIVWLDAGITSQHTISIPMRFIEGEWRLTSVEYWSDSLEFVQSVEL